MINVCPICYYLPPKYILGDCSSVCDCSANKIVVLFAKRFRDAFWFSRELFLFLSQHSSVRTKPCSARAPRLWSPRARSRACSSLVSLRCCWEELRSQGTAAGTQHPCGKGNRNWWWLESYNFCTISSTEMFLENPSPASSCTGEKAQWETCSLQCSEEDSPQANPKSRTKK